MTLRRRPPGGRPRPTTGRAADARERFPARCSAFDGHRRLASGALLDAALAIRRATAARAAGPLLVIDDETGRVVDVDVRGSEAQVAARLAARAVAAEQAGTGATDGDDVATTATRRRGRPTLGVVGREVTLLPRHWEWLNAQPGGASAALRRLVEGARREEAPHAAERRRQEAAYRFVHAVGGDLPDFDEAARALFAGARDCFTDTTAGWPADVRDHAMLLAFGEHAARIAERLNDRCPGRRFSRA